MLSEPKNKPKSATAPAIASNQHPIAKLALPLGSSSGFLRYSGAFLMAFSARRSM